MRLEELRKKKAPSAFERELHIVLMDVNWILKSFLKVNRASSLQEALGWKCVILNEFRKIVPALKMLASKKLSRAERAQVCYVARHLKEAIDD